jgi:phytoene dehydrogenase-like protein
MPCEDCEGFQVNPKWHRRFDPSCLKCGGRYLWSIQRTPMGVDTKREYLRKVLATWMAYGYAEADLRALSKRNWLEKG